MLLYISAILNFLFLFISGTGRVGGKVQKDKQTSITLKEKNRQKCLYQMRMRMVSLAKQTPPYSLLQTA